MPYDPKKDYRLKVGGTDRETFPFRAAVAITPSDGSDLTLYPRSIYVGTAGNVKLVPIEAADDTGVLFKNVPAGAQIIGARRVLATGTTAADIVGLL